MSIVGHGVLYQNALIKNAQSLAKESDFISIFNSAAVTKNPTIPFAWKTQPNQPAPLRPVREKMETNNLQFTFNSRSRGGGGMGHVIGKAVKIGLFDGPMSGGIT